MDAAAETKKRTRWHWAAWLTVALAALAAAGVSVMFVYWPFRYREVHPLLEQEFHSRVEVERYYRTYFPHPGFVADGVTFWRRGHAGEPPLAQVEHLHVVGTWSGLLFTPHTLYQIWVRGARVRVVLKEHDKPAPKGSEKPGGNSTQSAGAQTSANAGSSSTKPGSRTGKQKRLQDNLSFETIVADGATLDLLRPGKPPLHFVFETLQIHNVHAGEPLTFFTRARLPGLRALVAANGTLGPLRPGHYAETPLDGGFSVAGIDLRRLSPLWGTASASGRYSGRVDQIAVEGKVAIPNFRVGEAHVERIDAAYSAMVKVPWGEVDITSAKVQMAGSTILANATIAGKPKIARVEFAATDGNLERLLEVVEKSTPSVAGKVSFAAQAQFGNGSQPFLKRLRLQGKVAVTDVTFVQDGTQQKMDAFSARASKRKSKDPVRVSAAAIGETTFRDGIAYFRDLRATLPGAKAQLAGTFNLLNTRVNMTGKVAMQQKLSKDVGGWKRLLLAPLNPFFRHGKEEAVVPIAVTGTAQNPKIGQNLFHTK